MERKYSRELLEAMAQKQKTVTERGLPILVKPIPDDDRPGAMDPRLYVSMVPMLKGFKGMLVRMMMKRMGKGNKMDANQLRKMMNGIKSIPITEGVITQRMTVPNGDIKIPVRIYRPEKPGDGLQPVFYYIHGGGWAAGSPDVVEEMCKLVVEKTGYVSVNVDYRLCPESPYPACLDDCFAVLKWIYANASEFGGDGNRICVSGDSAGGNLTAACALRDRNEDTNMVKVQALIYPSLNMIGEEDENFHFSIDEFEIHPDHAKAINMMLNFMHDGLLSRVSRLLGTEDVRNPYLNPYLNDLKGQPPCIILYGEHDFLRVECESYARKLMKADVEVKAVRYRGLGHGFADVVGGYPQAEDCMTEIGIFMKEHFDKA